MNATASQQAAYHSLSVPHHSSLKLHNILYEINIITSLAGWVKVRFCSQSTVPHRTQQSL